MDTTAQEPLRALILQALAEDEAQLAAAEPAPGGSAEADAAPKDTAQTV